MIMQDQLIPLHAARDPLSAETRRLVDRVERNVEGLRAFDAKYPRVSLAGESRPALPFLGLDEIAANGIPPIPWLIEGWLARRNIVLLAGRAGAGKSTLVVNLAVAIASGRDWCGLKPVETGSVIYCDEEAGEAEIARQCLRHGALGLPNLHISSCVGLRLDDEGIPLHAALCRAARTRPAQAATGEELMNRGQRSAHARASF
jgi:hypothetical protein